MSACTRSVCYQNGCEDDCPSRAAPAIPEGAPTCSDEMREMVERLVIEASEQGYTAFAAPVTHALARAKVEATVAALLSAISRYEQIVSWVRIQHTTDGLPRHRDGECVFCTLLNEEVAARLSVEEPSNG